MPHLKTKKCSFLHTSVIREMSLHVLESVYRPKFITKHQDKKAKWRWQNFPVFILAPCTLFASTPTRAAHPASGDELSGISGGHKPFLPLFGPDILRLDQVSSPMARCTSSRQIFEREKIKWKDLWRTRRAVCTWRAWHHQNCKAGLKMNCTRSRLACDSSGSSFTNRPN